MGSGEGRPRAPKVALVGLRCCGKTSVGRELARALGLGFVDLDEAIAWSAGEGCCAEHAPSVARLVAEHGWTGFREMERRELARVLEAQGELVVATGGGAVEREDNRRLLRSRARCVWLREELDVLRRRLAADGGARPALTGGDAAAELDEIAARREPLYAEVAELVVDGGGRGVEEIAREIARRLAVR
jgi:shikimate kinase